MKIRKPYAFILSKKYPDKYFDWNTGKEFPHSEINKYPMWYKEEYDNNGRRIYYENSDGDWIKWSYNTNGNLIYGETRDGWWEKREYDTNGNEIYMENSYGDIKHYRR